MKCLNKAQRILSSQYENDREITSITFFFSMSTAASMMSRLKRDVIHLLFTHCVCWCKGANCAQYITE